MKTRTLIIFVLAGLLVAVFTPHQDVFAGGAEGFGYAADGGTIGDKEVWGVVVLNCAGNAAYGTLRVKSVENCVVAKDAEAFTFTLGCPADEAGFVNLVFFDANLFSGEIVHAVITKVKNFDQNGDIISFDAQIKDYTPPPPSS